MDETHVVTCFLRNDADVLLFRRSDRVGTYQGQWGVVSGHAEGDPDAAARQEIAEETGLRDAVTFVRAGDPFTVEDADLDRRWVVHPYLFDCDDRDVTTNEETTDYEWVPPTELLHRETVPDLWRSYDAVAPTVETVRTDATHGSAYVSVRALEVLRDQAAVLAADGSDWGDLADLADDLAEARPSMAALGNRVNRVMAAATDDRTPEAVEAAATDVIDDAIRADRATAANAADRVAGKAVVTLSRSGTVTDALLAAAPDHVLVAESRPAREGVGVAETLADAGIDVTLTTDAAVASLLDDVDVVLVGADTVLPDGAVVNKVGTRAAALAAAREGVPVYAACARDKVSTDPEPVLEAGDPAAVYDGPADLAVENPVFDVTPADLVTGVVTEDGALDADDVAAVADDLRDLADW
ncbi:NUDIX domain-containing protein [Halobacteriaceae archaeon GCM10025711]